MMTVKEMMRTRNSLWHSKLYKNERIDVKYEPVLFQNQLPHYQINKNNSPTLLRRGKDFMDKEFSTITLNNNTDFYRRNLFSTTTMTVNGAKYEIVSVNPTADAPTVIETIKYLINGK